MARSCRLTILDPDAGAENAERLLALPDLLRDRGVDDRVLSFPRIPLGRLPDALEEWGLR